MDSYNTSNHTEASLSSGWRVRKIGSYVQGSACRESYFLCLMRDSNKRFAKAAHLFHRHLIPLPKKQSQNFLFDDEGTGEP